MKRNFLKYLSHSTCIAISTSVLISNTAMAADKRVNTEFVIDDHIGADGYWRGEASYIETDALPLSSADIQTTVDAERIPIIDNGDPQNRIDLAFVGDGYTESEISQYAIDVANATTAIFSSEPLRSYKSYFNVHQVNVVSNESGIDNDSVKGVLRDTALDMKLYCDNIRPRILCVNGYKARLYGGAFNGPESDSDVIAALANSDAHGGRAYMDSYIFTASARSPYATSVIPHELGHILGRLGDEYGGSTNRYYGAELEYPNLSTLDANAMSVAGTKWSQWLGFYEFNFAGLINTYEGGFYNEYGVYRPSQTSIMREVNSNQFNIVSAEALIEQIYNFVRPIDDASPTHQVYTETDELYVSPLQPLNSPLDIQWYHNGAVIPGATEAQLSIASLNLAQGQHEISVSVVDNTPWVRNETSRSNLMTDSRHYAVSISGDTQPPIPDIKANGEDTPLTISKQTALQISVSLNANGALNQAADWWGVASSPMGMFYYEVASRSWQQGLACSMSEPLRDITSYELLNMTGLPTGDYTFYFALDMTPNCSLPADLSELIMDTVQATITD